MSEPKGRYSNKSTPPGSNPIPGNGWVRHVKAMAVLGFIVVNLSLWLCPLMVLVLLKWLIPAARFRRGVDGAMAWVYRSAVQCDSWVLFGLMDIRLEVEGMADRYTGDFYLVIANHQSWSDIFILQHLFNRKAPVLKFLVKKELIFMPLVGLICWAYDYPFLHRRSHKSDPNSSGVSKTDRETLNRSLGRFLGSTASIINFAEGTRYSPAKARKQGSPFRHLLKPRAGGLNAIFQMVGTRLDAVVDVTLAYDAETASFWRFIGGGIRRVKIHAETLVPGEILHDGEGPQEGSPLGMTAEWINERWALKDRVLSRLTRSF